MIKLVKLYLIFIVFLITSYGYSQFPREGGLVASEQEKITALLNAMTPEEKAGQLSLFASGWDTTGPFLSRDNKELIRKGKVGAILNAYTVDYVHELQRMAVEESRLKIPLLFGFDVIHGHRTIFPIPLAQACSWDMALIEQSERIAAQEATAEGLNWTFAPMVDIARDPRWGRVAECAGEDTWLGCKIAEARVRGFQGKNLKAANTMMACVKHFAAYGAPQAGRDYGTVDMSLQTLFEYYLPAYKAAIDAGAGSVMTSFNEISGVPSTGNQWLLKNVLRSDWHFPGIIVSDWTSINEMVNHGYAENTSDAARLAMLAGVDIDMQGSAYLNYIPELLRTKKVSRENIDNAVRKVLEAKMKLGLFDDPFRYCKGSMQNNDTMSQDKLAFARKFVARSCVLLKNPNRILPVIESMKKIAVIGPLGNTKADMLGAWSAAGIPENSVTLLEGIQSRIDGETTVIYERGCNTNNNDTSGFQAAVHLASSSDFVILALGENDWMSGEAASRSSLDLPGNQNELAEVISKLGKPTAVVLFNGRPLTINKLNHLPIAILETWFGGTQAGNGIADVLFGIVNPSGKLTMTFPRNVGQIPIFYNGKNTGRPINPADTGSKYVSRYLDCPNDPLFPFGFGLSYTKFSYADLNIHVQNDSIKVQVEIENTGDWDGEEVVQLYIRDKVASTTRPVKELKDFKKMMIKKGQRIPVSFSLGLDDLSFYHQDLKKYREPGEFEIFVGTNSAETISKTIIIK